MRLLLWDTVKGFTQTAKVFRHTHGAPARFETERHPVYDRPVTVRYFDWLVLVSASTTFAPLGNTPRCATQL